MNNTFLNIFFNISTLVMIATLLINIPFFQKVIIHENSMKIYERILLGIIMGCCCILSNCFGIRIDNAVLNSRVIGALGAALLGGPVSGIIAAVIGTVHRYIMEPNGITIVGCCIATIVETFIGIGVWYYFTKKNKSYGNTFLFILTALCETLHMSILLLIVRPFDQAVHIVNIIAVPMVLFNAVGMVIFFSVFRNVYKQQDKLLSEKMVLAFEIADKTLPYLVKTIKHPDNFQTVIDIIMQDYKCEGVAIANRSEYLGKSDLFIGRDWIEQTPYIIRETMNDREAKIWDVNKDIEVSDTQQEYFFKDLFEKNVALTAPLIVADEVFGCIVMFVRRKEYYSRAELSFISGIANLFSTQLAYAQLERQKKLLKNAELQTLQSQINPHFLFNALNTISCFCREKPEKARELLMALTLYFRNTLKAIDSMVTVEEEMEHVKAYLEIESARFDEKLKTSIEVEEECNKYIIPSLILQPIVENAVKHGAMTMDKGVVEIRIYSDSADKICLEVFDNGAGFPETVIQSIETRKKEFSGIGLWNVNERLISIYGEESSLKLFKNEDKTVVRMLIPKHMKQIYS